MNLIKANEARIARMSGSEVMALITELSQYLTQTEIESVEVGSGELTWREVEPS
jgi:hypothetical protein